MNKKILISLCVIGAVAAIAVGGTIAFFSDTETSTGNTFTAGSIDLNIDNHAWFNGVEQTQLSWGLSDLTSQLFFNYTDLKPGDLEEDTVGLHVDNNPSWVCANLTLTKNDDMTCTEPEMGDDSTCAVNSDLWDGDLAQNLNFVFWADDGDNVLETGETVLMEGPAGSLGATGITYPIVDSTYNAFGTVGQPFPGATTKYIGKAFCFGTLTKVPVAQGQGNPATNPGVTCNGAAVDNASQSDSMMGNISFTAIQSRNNANFRCVPRPLAFVLTDPSEQNALNAVSQDKPWYTYVVNGLCIDFTYHNPTYVASWPDFQIDGDPGTYIAGLSNIVITQGPLAGQPVGNLYSDVEVPAFQTVTITKCGTSEIKLGVHYGMEQEWDLDWATFTAQ